MKSPSSASQVCTEIVLYKRADDFKIEAWIFNCFKQRKISSLVKFWFPLNTDGCTKKFSFWALANENKTAVETLAYNRTVTDSFQIPYKHIFFTVNRAE